MTEDPVKDEATVPTQANTYCVYIASSNSTKLVPAIANNDTLCMPCPDGGACRGVVNQPRNLLVVDGAGNKERIQLTLQNQSCISCPAGGKTGYTFGATGGDLY